MGTAYVFNAKTLAMTRWNHVPGKQIVNMGGAVFAPAVGGTMVAAPAAFADGEITTAKYDFKTAELKNVRHAYLGAALDAPMDIEVSTDVAPSNTYQTLTNSDSILREHRATFGRGLKARFWWFKLMTSGKAVLREFGLNLHGKERRL